MTLNKKVKHFLENKTIYGREITGTSKTAKMNMILAGDGHTNITEMDALSEPIKEKFDIILTNYPFSQPTEYSNLYGLNTSEGNPVFLMHIIDALKKGGKAGVVVPDGVLFGKGKDYIKVRKTLSETCNIEAIIQLNTAVFRPYTAQPTSILIFKKGEQTKKIWFFEITEDGFKKTASKKGRPPIKDNDIPFLRGLWNNKTVTQKSFFVDFKNIKGVDEDYNLFMNYHKSRKFIKNSKKLMDICENPIIGGTPSKKHDSYYGGNHLWVNISDMKEKVIINTETKLSNKGKEQLKSKKISKGTLLMSFKLTLGKTAFAGKDLFTNEAICGLTPKDKSDTELLEYLYYILPLMDYSAYAQRASKGFTLNKDLLSNIEIPFPNKVKRKEIIKNLKSMNQELEKLKREVKHKENEIKKYMKTLLA